MDDITIEEIVESLETPSKKYNRVGIENALAYKDKIVPRLLDILQKTINDPQAELNRDSYFGSTYALFILAHFREHKAHDLIIALARLPGEILFDLFDDVVTQDFARILWQTSGGIDTHIRELILDTKANLYSRAAGLDALCYGVAEGALSRDKTIGFISHLIKSEFDAINEIEDNIYIDAAASCICDLYPEKEMETIELAYEKGLIDPGFIGIESFEQAIRDGKENTLKRCFDRLQKDLSRDIHSHMEWWACFKLLDGM